MRRPSLLASATAMVLLLVVATASAASPETGTIVNVQLGLKASNGLRAQLETSDDGTVTLELRRENLLASYEVKGRVTEEGLKARFGRLGLIDVAFTPTRTLGSTEPSEGCTGEPRTVREGIFTGTIDFTGEREYVRIEGDAEGRMSVIPEWQCPDSEEPMSLAGASGPLALSSQKRREAATLYAGSRRCACLFVAAVHRRYRGGRSLFYLTKEERHEGMEIVRATVAKGGPSAFDFDHSAGTATVHPPPPFRGHASFKDRPHGRDRWRSTIRGPLLGVGSVSLFGPGFGAILYPEDHLDNE
ncbi:MAG TPA: hypothetical protein VMR96_03190 [Solirubrobacterales bacterium]|nr:hypothetical protein [Solirubrobacterales bacterium]